MIKNTSSLISPFVLFEGDGGGNGGTGTIDPPVWHEQLDQSLKGNEALSQFRGVSDLARKHLELGEELSGLKGKVEGMVSIPKDGSTAEEIANFNKALGVPDSIDGYQFSTKAEIPADFPDDVKAELGKEIEAYDGMIRRLAHEAGLPPKAADAFHAKFTQAVIESAKAQEAKFKEQRTEAMGKLQDKWKNETESRVKESVRVHETLDKISPGWKDFAEKTGLGNEPEVIQLMDALRTRVLDDKMIAGWEGGSTERTAPGSNAPMFSFKGLQK